MRFRKCGVWTCEYRTTRAKPGHIPTTNGCGSSGSEWVPDSNWGKVDFTPACNAHDICYGTCGTTHQSCDNSLANAMEAACLEWWNSWWGYITVGTAYFSCVAQAEIYRGTLLAGGGMAFDNAQDEACEFDTCCR